MKAKQFFALVMILMAGSSIRADDIAVTVYNSNLGVVSETRTLELEKGVNRFAFRDVPDLIDPASVRFEIIDKGKQATILEQNYAYDLVRPDQLYSKYLDGSIELIDEDGRLYEGTLLAYGGGTVTLGYESGKVKIIDLDKIIEVNFPALPEGLITRPTLFWLYRSAQSGAIEARVGYQTSGLTWTAEYVGVLDEKETGLELTGWSSINNTSGKTFKDATLKLVAGDIHRADQRQKHGYGIELSMSREVATDGFAEKEFFEYHLYTLPRKATLANKELKQISLFEPATTTVSKIYLYQPQHNPKKVKVAIEFKNSKATGLGMPLPAGRIRMFKADDDGSMILIGEDRIKHTPKDEDLKVTVGHAFDIVPEEKLVDQVRVSSKVEERTWEIEIRNRKNEDIVVTVEKNLYGYWDIIETSHEFEKKDANTVTFEMPVSANKTATLRLKVRFTSR
jgi:hypothetical protein